MATSFTAVPRRVVIIGARELRSSASRSTISQASSIAHYYSSISAQRYSYAVDSHHGQMSSPTTQPTILPIIRSSSPTSHPASWPTPQVFLGNQLRCFSSQVDGLSQTETFKEYRLRQEIELRRRTLRELENDALRSQVDLADLRLELSEQQLNGILRNRSQSATVTATPSVSSSTATTTTTAAAAAAAATTTKILQSLTPHENIYTIPNFLTFTRLIAAPAVGYAILTAQPTLALSLFAYAGATDAVDGYLARRYNQTTVVGTVIDPMADKLLMTIAVVSLAIQATIPLWLAVIIIGRDVGLAISAIYFRYISLPPPKTFARYWDFSLPSAEVHPTEISKINTLLQLLLIGSAMALPVLRENAPTLFDAWNLGGVVEGWSYLVGGTTVWSGLSYIGNKDAVKILSEEDKGTKGMEVKDLGPLYRKG